MPFGTDPFGKAIDMDALWRWLMQANAKGVFLSSLMAFLAVVAWWTWKESGLGEDRGTVFSQKPIKESSSGNYGLLDMIEEQLNQTIKAPVNPFISPFVPDSTGRLVRRDRSRHVPVKDTKNVATKPPWKRGDNKKPNRSPRKPARVKKVYQLTYKGIFKRPDGSVLALIEDSGTKRIAFYSENEEIHGMTVGKIENDKAGIVMEDGSVIDLKLSEKEPFEEEEANE